MIAISPNLITKCQIWAFVYIQKKEVSILTEFNHSLHRRKAGLCKSLCKITLSIIIYYVYLHRLHSKKGVKHYFGENCILEGIKHTIS
nr:MAG TPA: hypothetical protein [Caudoviricetes sp.]